jgi:hypothetical protein
MRISARTKRWAAYAALILIVPGGIAIAVGHLLWSKRK